MENVIVSADKSSGYKKRKKYVALICGMAILFAAIYIGTKVPYVQDNILQPRCSGDTGLIADFNAARTAPTPSATTETISSRIDSKLFGSKDATCGYMLIALYAQQGNRQKAVETYRNYPNLDVSAVSVLIQDSTTEKTDVLQRVSVWSKEPNNPSGLEIQG